MQGVGPQFVRAVKEIDARLRIYPQFGEPLRDLKTAGETLRIMSISPLVVRYIIDENERAVFVVAPFQPMRGSGV